MARWLIWTCVMIVWTVVLEVKFPDPGGLPAGELIVTNKYLFTKSLHVAAYAVLAALSAWVPMPVRYRWVMMFILMGHAWGTEFLQLQLEEWCHRGGSLADVGYDMLGIGLGAAASWKWWAGKDQPLAA